MSGFQDQSIDEGVRKRTRLPERSLRARLALNVERQDRGILQIPVASDIVSAMRSTSVSSRTPSWP